MPRIPREVAEHKLDIRPEARPAKQHLRWFDDEKHRAIREEVAQLLGAGFIKEVFHPEWIANLVLVQKKSGKWDICVDYTSLNKACPTVPYPFLASIRWSIPPQGAKSCRSSTRTLVTIR